MIESSFRPLEFAGRHSITSAILHVLRSEVPWRKAKCTSIVRRSRQKSIRFLLRGNQPFRQTASVVFGHPVFPLEKIGDGLRLNSNFHPPQTRQQKIHFVLETSWRPQILSRRLDAHRLAPAHFQQSPSRRQFIDPYENRRSQVITLTADSV